ncbi:EAL domain-containing protein [Roseomonas sp. USHLN139]|uniref:EAL domain-containing protein n=1 Tax=Roseomonas sp. USHLN139 TaxID=3081298 RepID=UPI003B02ABC6
MTAAHPARPGRHPGESRAASQRPEPQRLESQRLEPQCREAAPEQGVALLDPQGRVLGWNEAAARLLGWPAGALPGRPLASCFPPEAGLAGRAERLLRQALDGAGQAQAEFWLRRRDGAGRLCGLTLSPLRDAAGAVLGLALTIRDLGAGHVPEAALHASEAQLAGIMRYSAVGMALIGLDGAWLEVNRAVCELLGYTREELTSLTFQSLTHAADLAADLAQVRAMLAGRIDSYRMEKRYRRRDGTLVWGLLSVSLARDPAGRPQHFIAQIQDIDRLKRAEAALHEERDRLQVTLGSIGDGVITTDAQGFVTFLNPVAEAMTGWPLDQALGRPIEAVFDIVAPQTALPLDNPVRQALAEQRVLHLHQQALLGRAVPGRAAGEAAAEAPPRRLDIQHSAAPIRDKAGRVIGAVLVFQDVSALRSMQRELEFSALHDALTGLPNRRKFEAVLVEAVESARERGLEHALCFIDLDRFKIVNDTAGHAAGDALLRAVAGLLSQELRPQDLVARLGGDEFAIILFDRPAERAMAELDRLRFAIAAVPFLWEGHAYPMTASMGVAAITAASGTRNTVMKQADVACYAAKHAGRNRIIAYAPDAREGADRHREIIMAAELREALREGRFRLHAQRILAIRPGGHTHHELLLRLVARDGSLVPPALFIPVAERYDLMAELDRWVLAEVLQRRAPALAAVPDLALALNISANSLNEPGFLAFFLGLLEASPLSPAMLTLEITETALVANIEQARGIIDRIRAQGCRVALDDFGAGLSSFGYLRAFRVDGLKIDGTFIRNLPDSPIDLAIVRSITRIAREIGAMTVAEFVEDVAILDLLAGIGVDCAQGHAIGRPQELDLLLPQWLAAGSAGGGRAAAPGPARPRRPGGGIAANLA